MSVITDWGEGAFPAKGAEFARHLRGRDWSDCPLGPPEGWSDSLKTTVGLMLAASAQIVVFWGREFVALYNDAYAPTIGDKHPRALGRPAQESWGELWDDLEPLLSRVVTAGETVWAKDRPFQIDRRGYLEQVFFDISYSPVWETGGAIGGVLCIVSETTDRVLAQRQLAEQKTAVEEMNRRLSEETAFLRASEARFRALVNATSDVLYRMSPDWREMRHIEGRGFLADVEGPTVSWMDEYLFPEDRERVLEAVERAVRGKTAFQLEHRVRRIDGAPGWIFSRAVPLLDEAGEIVEWFGAASDISPRREAEEHLKLVINELNHRVKNTLATLQSIGEQTFRNAEDLAAAREKFLDRIMALSHANDLLNAEHWVGASLSDVVALTTEPERTGIEGPDVQLDPKSAMSLCMALHELAANARKHGAWSNEAGRVQVAWDMRGDRLVMEWRERGGPPVTAPARRGFGSRLIERGLAGELGGQVTLDFEVDGLVCRIEAPIPSRGGAMSQAELTALVDRLG